LKNASTFLAVAVIGGAVAVAIWFFVEIARRILDALDALGTLAFTLPIVILLVCGCVLALAGTWHALEWLRMRRRRVHPDRHTALYPQVLVSPGNDRVWLDLNAPGAQAVACLPRTAKVNAAALDRVLSQPAQLAAPEPAWPALPASDFPKRVEVYDAPMSKEIAVPVGVDGAGQQVVLPLRGLGNILIGGLPNYGKSELLGSMAAGLLRQDPTGKRSQLAVIDMKLVSFGNMPGLDALAWPVACTIEEAHEIIAAVRTECVRRFVAMREARARTLEEYELNTGQHLPYITVLVDEVADLTQDEDRARRDRFLAAAMEIARRGRAAGTSLALATQRPSADSVPASLRNLAGAAVAFKVQRNHDSVAILGETGAEALPALPGRCLVKRSGTVEVQAYACGLEGGRFDAFLATLPGGGVAAPAWPVRDTAVPEAAYRPPNAPSVGKPAFRTDQSGSYTAEQVAYIQSRYVALGKSLKAVQRELYDGQEGGHWFYAIRDAVQLGK
jgi:hypothetical protein